MDRRIATPEVFARHAATGLTKQTYDAVLAADAACSAAEADLAAAEAEALAGPLAQLEDWLAALYIETEHPALVPLYTLVNAPTPVAECRKAGELYPVKTWLAVAAKTRRKADRIRREIAALTELAA